MGSDYLFSLNNTKRGPGPCASQNGSGYSSIVQHPGGAGCFRHFSVCAGNRRTAFGTVSKKLPGRACPFAVSRSMRKSGIGRALFEKHLAYLHSQNIREFSCSQTQAVIIRFMSTGAWCGAQKRSTPFRPAAFRKRCVFSSMISSRAPRPESLPQTQKAPAARHRPDKLPGALPTFWERGQA